jgi:transposase InsO family protein
VAIPLKEATAAELAKAIFDQIVVPFGAPKEFLTDQGSNYLSSGFKRFLAATGAHQVTTLGYHPQTNGKSERFNGILEAAFFRLNTTGDPSKWEDFLAPALFSTRIHASDSSGFSPFELLYGVKPRLPKERRRMIAADPALPGAEELKAPIETLNKSRTLATEGTAERAA